MNDILLDLLGSNFEFTNRSFTFWAGQGDLDGNKVWIGLRIHESARVLDLVFIEWRFIVIQIMDVNIDRIKAII